MRVFKRGKSWYADYMVNGRRIMKSFGQHKKMAELFLKDVELKEARGELKLVDESLTWNDFQLRYLEHARVSKSSTTFRSDLCRLKVFNKFLKERNVGKLKQIDPLLLEDLKIQILPKNGPKTFNHHLDLIRTMLNRAVEWKFLRENPLVDFKRLKNNRVRQVRFLNKEEIERVNELWSRLTHSWVKS